MGRSKGKLEIFKSTREMPGSGHELSHGGRDIGLRVLSSREASMAHDKSIPTLNNLKFEQNVS